MEKLKNTKKITLATLKAFAKRNEGNLFTKTTSCFDGMSDMVEPVAGKFEPTRVTTKKGYYKTGIRGIYTVGGSRDYFEIYEDEIYFGLTVWNSCGETILAVKK